MFDLTHKLTVSSKHLHATIQGATSLTFRFDGERSLYMGNISQPCPVETKTNRAFEFHISLDRANRMLQVLEQLKEQPITIIIEQGVGRITLQTISI